MKHIFAVILSACTAITAGWPALIRAQDVYPNKPIRIIVPFPPGGPIDPLFRSVAQFLTESMGQQVLVENRAGATGAIGLSACAKSPPDGYTLCGISSDSLSVLPHLSKQLPYDAEKDFTPIAQLVYVRAVLVANPRAPFNNFTEMIAYATANPGKLNFGSFGEGGAAHQALEIIKRATTTRITHVPYKGSGPAIQAAVAGEVDLALSTVNVVLPLIRAGRLKPLSLPGEQRMPVLPDVPTYKELGIGQELRSWFGLMGPAGIPREVVIRVNREVVRVLQSNAYREKFVNPVYYETSEMNPQQFAEFLMESRIHGKQIADLLHAAGYRAE